MTIVCSALLGAATLPSCLPEADVRPVRDAREESILSLLDEWDGLDDTDAVKTTKRTAEIVQNLADMEALDRLLERLGDPRMTPVKKVNLVRTAAQNVTPNDAEILGTLCSNEFDDTTRASAAVLLGFAGNSEFSVVLNSMTADVDPRVAFAAALSLARLGDKSTRNRLTDTYLAEEYDAVESFEVIRLVLERTESDDVPVLTKAVLDPHTNTDQRIMVVAGLAQIGEMPEAAVLEDSKRVSDDPAYPGIADAAIRALTERVERNSTPEQ